MQSRRKWMQKTLALITVIILLVMMLPAAALAAGNGNGKGNRFGQTRAEQAHAAKLERVKGEDDPEDLEDPEDPEDMEEPEENEDPEEMSEWAMYVHARNEWAKEIGLAPGHANLLDKLLDMGHEMPTETETPVVDRITTLNAFYTVNFMAEAELGVKAFMSKIKGVRKGTVVIPEIS